MTRTIGRSDYHRFCEALGLQPDERLSATARAAVIPRWLRPEMLAPGAARGKLRAWAERTPRDAWDAPGDPAVVLIALHAYGDPVIPHEVARTLCRLPRPVRDYAVRTTSWLCIGHAFAGWCGSRPELDRRG